LKLVHGVKTGTPPRCDLERESELQGGLRSLIYSGAIKSAHDCSEGGLAVALAECCIAQQIARDTPRLTGAQVDLSAVPETRLDALLFGETQCRVILSVAPLEAVKVIERARILGLTAARLGLVGGTELKIKLADRELSWSLAELHDAWWNSIARIMRAQGDLKSQI
jgi:phosphoribosylformylglycinamidine synthase